MAGFESGQGTNPFRDDADLAGRRSNSESPKVRREVPTSVRSKSMKLHGASENGSVSGGRHHRSISEEKDSLRKRYSDRSRMQQTGSDMPPTYDECCMKPRRDSKSKRHHHHQRDKKRTPVTPRNVDTIDKMDVTGIFGSSFHHDGPFDAVTPHRNKNKKAAPVMAFPIDGPNNTIATKNYTTKKLSNAFTIPSSTFSSAVARSPTQSRSLHHPLYNDSSSNNSSTTLDAIRPNTKNVTQFDAKAKTERISGPTTMGLGSTTFLDGAPASATVIEHQKNHLQPAKDVQRKKSLSRKIKDSIKI